MQPAPEFDAWRLKARQLLAAGRAPEDVHWDDAIQASLLDSHDPAQPNSTRSARDLNVRAEDIANARIRIPSRLLELLEACACHSDPRRHALMYRLLWRATRGERELLGDAADEDVRTLTQMAKSVDRDCHKMHAYVRFRELSATADTSGHFVAAYTPEHHILRRVAPFFVKRFGTMVWTIVTPDGAAHWDRARLSFLH